MQNTQNVELPKTDTRTSLTSKYRKYMHKFGFSHFRVTCERELFYICAKIFAKYMIQRFSDGKKTYKEVLKSFDLRISEKASFVRDIDVHVLVWDIVNYPKQDFIKKYLGELRLWKRMHKQMEKRFLDHS